MANTTDEPSVQGSRTPLSPEERRRIRKQVVAVVVAAVVAAFAVLNLGRVKVNWIVTTGHTPLIIVIVVSFALGIGADRLVIARGRRRRKDQA